MTNETFRPDASGADYTSDPRIGAKVGAYGDAIPVTPRPEIPSRLGFSEKPKPPQGPTLTAVCDRLVALDSRVASIYGDCLALNERLGGATPTEGTGTAGSTDPNGCLGYAHQLISDVNNRLDRIEEQIKRLFFQIGD